MKKNTNFGKNTICTHVGELKDEQFNGSISPLYMATSYAFDGVDVKRYPRYFNTPNQLGVSEKIAALEGAEAALLLASGMAAISTSMLAFLERGDHVVLQETLYGGTYNFVKEELEKFGITYTLTKGMDVADFEEAIQANTRLIFIETPSNPLLKLVDIEAVAALAKSYEIRSMIDNTFATPINQNPIALGIDVVVHSATKYLGGHSDILAGAVVGTARDIHRIWDLAKNLGGSLSEFTVWMLERSLKTLNLRVQKQCENAMELAMYLEQHKAVDKVHYPGLLSHPQYQIAQKQMSAFGGMLSFELKEGYGAMEFQRNLELIKSSMSLAGVESTVLSPSQTSHALLSEEERARQGISDRLLRFSVGIEDTSDLIEDINQAIERSKIKKSTKKEVQKSNL